MRLASFGVSGKEENKKRGFFSLLASWQFRVEKGGKQESIFGLLVSLVREKRKDKTTNGFYISVGHPLGSRTRGLVFSGKSRWHTVVTLSPVSFGFKISSRILWFQFWYCINGVFVLDNDHVYFPL